MRRESISTRRRAHRWPPSPPDGRRREDDDRDLVDALLGNTVNLRLYARAADIFERGTELAAAHSERGRQLRDLQRLYELRLAHAMDAVYELDGATRDE